MASYELASKGDQTAGCPDGKRDDSVYTMLAKDDTTLCFAFNLIEGRCYVDGDTTPPAYTVASCSAREALKVVRRVNNSTSAGQCSASSIAVAFPRPARVLCLASP
jgi:hypothetical protein